MHGTLAITIWYTSLCLRVDFSFKQNAWDKETNKYRRKWSWPFKLWKPNSNTIRWDWYKTCYTSFAWLMPTACGSKELSLLSLDRLHLFGSICSKCSFWLVFIFELATALTCPLNECAFSYTISLNHDHDSFVSNWWYPCSFGHHRHSFLIIYIISQKDQKIPSRF